MYSTFTVAGVSVARWLYGDVSPPTYSSVRPTAAMPLLRNAVKGRFPTDEPRPLDGCASADLIFAKASRAPGDQPAPAAVGAVLHLGPDILPRIAIIKGAASTI